MFCHPGVEETTCWLVPVPRAFYGAAYVRPGRMMTIYSLLRKVFFSSSDERPLWEALRRLISAVAVWWSGCGLTIFPDIWF
ncbi:hypothetical protein J6590_086078 [Homalodisca vitripennis]|nr:hypothetical protein J6590_086078 [Homalodisca vitripennis]